MTPVSYKDPFWSNLAQRAEQEVGLPANLLQNILLKGERSNADQVSSAGAKTPFQVIPETRQALLRKYNVDAYAGPEQAAKAAALLLKESLERNQGDITQAVGEYIGGTNRKNWGPVTNAYIQRVTTEGKPMVTAQQFEKIYSAYESGQMSPQEAQEFEADMNAGVFGNMDQNRAQPTQTTQPMQLPAGVVKAYREGRMTPQERSELEADIQAGLVAMPSQQPMDVPTPENLAATSAPVAPKEEAGFLDTLAGAGETALALGSGATTGMLGMLGGAAIGAGQMLADGTFGTQEGVRTVQKAALGGMQGGTYQPKTQAGQQMTGAIGDVLAESLPPVLPMIGPANALTQGVAPSLTQTAQRLQRAPAVGRTAEQAIPETATFAQETVRPTARGAAPAVAEQQQFAQVGDLVRKASGSGLGTAKAQEELAALAKVNPEAKAAADRLGIELPADVFSDNPQVVAAAGLTRSAAGSEAEAAWRNTVRTAADKADEVMNQLDASTDVSQVSENVRKSLLDTRTQLRNDAAKIYSDVDAAVPKSTPVEMNALRQQLDQVIEEVGVSGLNSVEKRLKAMLDSGEPITYARLIREKNVLGDKVGGKSPLEADLDTASAKRLYGALAQDQLDNVGRIGGDELRTQLRGANALYAKERALAKRIVNAYGSETDGSIAALMSRSVKNAQKGDSRDLAKLLKVVPKDLQKETLATAIMANTRSRSANSAVKGGFGFSEFTDFYRGLRNNSPLYGQISQVLGEDSMAVLRDMYEVSKRVTDARANVLTTGKANQALLNSMQAEGALGAILGKAGTGLGRAASATAGASVFGPVGAAVANLATDFLINGKPDRIKAAGKLFTDEKFQKLMTEAATKPASSPSIRSQVKALVRTPAFLRYAKTVNLTGGPAAYERFMLSAMTQPEQEQ